MAETVLITAASRGVATWPTQDGYALVTPERAATRHGKSPPPAGCRRARIARFAIPGTRYGGAAITHDS